MKKALLPIAVLLQHGVQWHHDNALTRKLVDQLEKVYPCPWHGLQTHAQIGLMAKLFLPALPPFTALVWLPHESCFKMLHYMVPCVLQQNLGYIKMKT